MQTLCSNAAVRGALPAKWRTYPHTKQSALGLHSASSTHERRRELAVPPNLARARASPAARALALRIPLTPPTRPRAPTHTWTPLPQAPSRRARPPDTYARQLQQNAAHTCVKKHTFPKPAVQKYVPKFGTKKWSRGLIFCAKIWHKKMVSRIGFWCQNLVPKTDTKTIHNNMSSSHVLICFQIKIQLSLIFWCQLLIHFLVPNFGTKNQSATPFFGAKFWHQKNNPRDHFFVPNFGTYFCAAGSCWRRFTTRRFGILLQLAGAIAELPATAIPPLTPTPALARIQGRWRSPRFHAQQNAARCAAPRDVCPRQGDLSKLARAGNASAFAVKLRDAKRNHCRAPRAPAPRRARRPRSPR
jgi:hypothetical protein